MPPTKGFASKLKAPKHVSSSGRSSPLWEGPCGQGANGGVTQSMIGNFLNCRERFRLKYVEGLRTADTFNHLIEYGNLWHACEEAHAKGVEWQAGLGSYVQELCKKYPLNRDLIDKWSTCCLMQFPIYVKYWGEHKDVVDRTPIFQEQVFDVHYTLPSGRAVRLRGKWDAGDLIGKGKTAGIWVQENKTKGDIDQEQLQRQLTFDLQNGMYLTAISQNTGIEALEKVKGWDGKKFAIPIKGVRYNVIRRPLSGGKGSIKQKEGSKNVKAETPEEYWNRLQQYFITEPEYWFMRWNAEIDMKEVENFQKRFLIPILEQMCDWYEWIKTCIDCRGQEGYIDDPYHKSGKGIHWQHVFGVYNALNEGGSSDYDNYLATGTDVGLTRREKMFEELQ